MGEFTICFGIGDGVMFGDSGNVSVAYGDS